VFNGVFAIHLSERGALEWSSMEMTIRQKKLDCVGKPPLP